MIRFSRYSLWIFRCMLILMAAAQLTVFVPAVSASIPSAPEQLTAINLGEAKVQLDWKAVSGATGYKVYRSINNLDFSLIATVSTINYTDTNLTPNTNYYYYVKASNNDGESAPSATVSLTTLNVDTQAPTVPGSVSAVALDQRSIKVTWTASTDNSQVVAYHVYTSLYSNKDFKSYSTTATSFVDSDLVPGTTYYYYVKALDLYGNYSNQSATVNAKTVSDSVKPSVPGNFTANVTGMTSVDLNWDASTDDVAMGTYNIYRKTGTGSMTKIKTVQTPGYTDSGLAPGTTYIYEISAVDLAGNESNRSLQISRTTLADSIPPSVPANFKATPSSSTQVSLTWTASTDDVKVSSYNIYRATGSGTVYTKIASTASLSYTDSYLNPLTQYFYRVTAIDSSGNESSYDSADAITKADTEKPIPPTLVKAKAVSQTEVELEWSGATDNVGIVSYSVYRAEGKTKAMSVGTSTDSSFSDDTVEANKTYKYHILARDGADNWSTASPTASVTTNGDTEKPIKPTNLILEMKGTTEVKLTWTASTDNKKVSGYYIYRSMDSGSFKQIAAVTSPTYTEKNMSANTTYKYYVIAYDEAGNESEASDTQSVYTASRSVEKTIAENESRTLEINGLAKLEVPSGALSKSATYKMVAKAFGSYTNTGYKTIAQPVEITAREGSTNITTFNKKLTLTMYYTSSELGSTSAGQLSIFFWDETGKKWAPLKSTVTSSDNKVTTEIDHLTVFALLIDNVAPPVPFMNSPGTSAKKVYDLTGQSENNAVVTVLVNGANYSAKADEKGNFSVDVYLQNGSNQILLRAKDTAGNESEWSKLYTVTANFNELRDIIGHWAEENILEIFDLGITTGYEDKTFRPDKTITRAEFCRFVISALKLQPETSPKLNFKDSGSIPDWAKGYIATAVKQKIISGYSDGTFKPSREISREEMASILVRAMGLQDEADLALNEDLFFDDSYRVQLWARGAVYIAVEQGIVSGYEDNTFNPARKASRAEAATMIVNMLANI